MKKWYISKTLWINLIAVAAIVIQGVTGKEIISTAAQGTILALVNLGLRVITKESIEW